MIPWLPHAGGPSGPVGNDSFTKVLLHMNNATTDSNAGGTAKTWTLNGAAAFSTAQVKFGSHSLLLNGNTADFLSCPDNTDFTFGSNDFTVDCWFYLLAANGVQSWIGGNGLLNGGVLIGRNGSNNMFGAVYDAAGSTLAQVIGSTTVTGTGWHHLAFVRSGSTFTLYIDGSSVGTASSGSAVADSNTAYHIGRVAAFALQPWNGYIDEFRLSIGIARWTANFSPPAAPYAP